VIKVFVRAIVPTEDSYLLMNEPDKDGKAYWDLPGGELKPGVDVRKYLCQVMLDNTGYTIDDLRFFEIVCRVTPRTRGGGLPATTIDFIFAATPKGEPSKLAVMETELLRFEKFEWLDSDGRFRGNKVMALLGRYHRNNVRSSDEARLDIHVEPDDEPTKASVNTAQ
jgi:hypothetical protein